MNSIFADFMVMEKLVVLLLLVTCGSTKSEAPTDLTGKAFTFPSESDTRYATLTPDMEGPFSAVTLCLRSFPDNSRIQTLFSLATPSHDNAFLLYKPKKGHYEVSVNNKPHDFEMPDNQNEWDSVCCTWDGRTGLTQVWVNGKRSIRVKISTDTVLAGIPIIILGQEQDNYGGGFAKNQCFVGDLTDVHMWNYVLDICEIQNYMNYFRFKSGNVLNWKALNYKVNDEVLVEPKQSGGCN
ncbi:C-reactive protein-like isoform X1 [Anguilla anguilla]|uniref:C-reactive protein-like isoform X1 n=1 Tax=Anguilla anguilla TaxID=7936 RepID=UPI0015AE5858|nr:C-reactive protein-like isoform X1 [Anguilla anguilla]